MVEPRQFLNTDAEASQERLVEDWLERHPWSTVPEIRTGIASESGWEFERVQSRFTAIQKRRHLHDRWREGAGVKEFMLGEVRPERRRKAFGLESKMFLGEVPETKIHRSDLADERVEAEVEVLREMIAAFVQARIVPLLATESAEQKANREFAELLAELDR